MTLETGIVCCLAVRNREIDALTGLVTRRAILFLMLVVTEPDAERTYRLNLGVTFAAIRKVVRAERAFVVVTCRTAIRHL